MKGIRCADLSGNVITNSCTSYFVECDNGLQIKPMPVAEGTKCLNGEIVHNSNCTASVCTQGDLVCSDASGIVDNTTCTDYFMQCFSGLFIEPQPVAYGTKCLQGKIVLASACTGAACDFEGIRCSDANGVIYENMCQSYFVQCNDGSFTAPMAVANGTRCYNGNLVNTAECSYQNCDFEGIKCTDANVWFIPTHVPVTSWSVVKAVLLNPCLWLMVLVAMVVRLFLLLTVLLLNVIMRESSVLMLMVMCTLILAPATMWSVIMAL